MKKPTSPQQIRKIRLKCDSVEFEEGKADIQETESNISEQSGYQMKVNMERITISHRGSIQKEGEVMGERHSKIFNHRQGEDR